MVAGAARPAGNLSGNPSFLCGLHGPVRAWRSFGQNSLVFRVRMQTPPGSGLCIVQAITGKPVNPAAPMDL